MWERGFPVTITFPPGTKVNTIGRRGRGWCKLEDGSIQATYFNADQLRSAFPGIKPDEVQLETILKNLVPTRAWAERRMTMIADEPVVAVQDIKTGTWSMFYDKRRWWWKDEKWVNSDGIAYGEKK